MTSSANTALTVAALRRIVEAEEECLCVHTAIATELCKPCWTKAIREAVEPMDVHGEHCQRCSGMGRVALFRSADGKALFSKPCPSCGGLLPPSVFQCGFCHGLGRLPLDVREVTFGLWLKAVHSVGLKAIVSMGDDGAVIQVYKHYLTDPYTPSSVVNPDDEEDWKAAALLALDAAVEARA